MVAAPTIVPEVARWLCLPRFHPCYSEGGLSIADRREGVKGAKGGGKSIMARRYVRLCRRWAGGYDLGVLVPRHLIMAKAMVLITATTKLNPDKSPDNP